MRFTRTKITQQKVVELADIPTLKKKTETPSAPESTQAATETEEATPATPARSQQHGEDQSETEETALSVDYLNQTHPIAVNDSTDLTTREKEEITNQALRAERLGKRSLLLGILLYVFLIAAFIAALFGLFGDTPLIIFAFLSFIVLAFISMVLGLIFGFKSLASPYNTTKGNRSAIVGTILSGIVLGFMLLGLLSNFL